MPEVKDAAPREPLPTAPMEIIRENELTKYDGLKPTQRQQLIDKGEYPRPVKLSARRKGWLASEIADWQLKRIATRDSTPPNLPKQAMKKGRS